jgi:sorbitol-specific phosphotransferase system component IIC
LALVNLDLLIIQVIINVIVIGPMLWIAGRLLAGKEKAKFTDAIWIAALGTLIGSLFTHLFSGIIALIIIILLWLALIRHFFDCGWGKAFLIAIVAAVIFAVIAFVLVLIGFVALRTLLRFP